MLWIVLTNLAAATQNGSNSTVGWGNRRQESWDTCVLCEWGSSGQILCVCVIVCNWWTQSSGKSTARSPFVSLIFFFSPHHTFVFFLILLSSFHRSWGSSSRDLLNATRWRLKRAARCLMQRSHHTLWTLSRSLLAPLVSAWKMSPMFPPCSLVQLLSH